MRAYKNGKISDIISQAFTATGSLKKEEKREEKEEEGRKDE